jgi:Tfp pilus assembly protein PilF
VKSITKRSRVRAKGGRVNVVTTESGGLAALSDRAWFIAIIAAAFFLRLGYLLQIDSIPLFYHLAGDGRTYDEWGQRIAAGDWLGQGVFYQAPLYPYFLGVLQVFFGNNLWLIRFLQTVLGAISCGLIFIVGQRLFARPAGIAAGLILAFYAPAMFYDGLIEKSILDLVLLSGLLFLLFASGREPKWRKWLACGGLIGLLGLSRENALILVPVIAAWIVFHYGERPLALRARWLGLLFAGLLLVLFPVGLRNLLVGGEFKLTTSQFGPNFYIGNNPVADGTYGSIRNVIHETQLEGPDAKRLAERALGRSLTPGQVSDYWFERAQQYISTQPGPWLRLLGFKWLLVWNSREVEDSDDFYIYQNWSWLLALLARFSHFGVLVPLAAVGMMMTWREWRKLWLLYAMIFSLAASVAAFYIFGRYRYPLVPLLVLFAGAGIIETFRLCRQRAWRKVAPALIVAIVVAAVINWPLQKISGAGVAGYNNLANALAKQGKLDQAIATAERALGVDPDYGVVHYNLGNLYMQQGKFDLAKTHFEAALRLLPNYAEAHANYGQLLAERGDLDAGMSQFTQAIELNPALSRAQLNLGVALAKIGKAAAAIGPLREAARLNPESPQASYYLGSVYAAQNRYAEAEDWFNQALRIEPNFGPAHQSLAQLLALQGKQTEAARHYQAALRLMRQGSGLPMAQ